MNRILPLSAILLVATIGAACTSASAGAGSQPPSATPPPASAPVPSTPAPSQPPVTTPEPTATPEPTDEAPTRIVLESRANDHVTIDILDESGRIVRAESGHPAEGASVPTGELKAENVDARTLRLTWTDIPGDNELGLYVNEAASVMLVIQPDHDGDAMAFDRVLIVEFDRPVAADDFLLGVQEGLDTAG
jgi:hypothetical protein